MDVGKTSPGIFMEVVQDGHKSPRREDKCLAISPSKAVRPWNASFVVVQ